jgi:hypothetical protein
METELKEAVRIVQAVSEMDITLLEEETVTIYTNALEIVEDADLDMHYSQMTFKLEMFEKAETLRYRAKIGMRKLRTGTTELRPRKVSMTNAERQARWRSMHPEKAKAHTRKQNMKAKIGRRIAKINGL